MNGSEAAASVYCPPKASKPWRFEDLLGGAPVRYFSFARRALSSGLRASGVGAGDSVLVPEFVCRDLLSSINSLGAAPVFYAVDKDLRPTAEPQDWPTASAAIAVNFFGFPADLEPFCRYRARTGALIIEDNAHGLFSRDAEGRLLGLRADLGLFSLRKTLALPNGAALVATGPDNDWGLERQSPFAGNGGLRPALKSSARWLAKIAGAPAAYKALRALRGLRQARTGNRLPVGDPASEENLPWPDLPCAALSKPLTLSSPELEANRRRALYEFVGSEIATLGLEPVFPRLPEGVVPYGFPFRLPEGKREAAFAQLARIGFEPMGWPDLPSEIAADAPAHYRDVHLVYFLW